MKTSENGRSWVRMGAMGPRAHGKTQKQGKQRKNDHLGHDLGSMFGEISPNMMFCDFNEKWCGWVLMGANGFA